MIRFNLLFFVFLSLFPRIQAQQYDMGFVAHLISQNDYQTDIDLPDGMFDQQSRQQSDSLTFYRAWANLQLQLVDQSISQFSGVSRASAFYTQAQLYRSWGLLYLGRSQLALNDLTKIPGASTTERELKNLQVAASHLLLRSPNLAEQLISRQLATQPLYEKQHSTLQAYAREMIDFNPKSQVLAGLFSAILPGSGKIYAGERGSGISSLLLLAGLGGMAVENIIKSGIMSWNGLLSTSLFGIFYLGNVYGSVISIKKYRQRFYEEKDQAIVATVLVPLRDFYQ